MQPKRLFRKILLFAFCFLTTSLVFNRANAQNCLTTNVAAGKPVTANIELSYAPASNITDGDLNTAWSGDIDAMYWAYVDLGNSYDLCHVVAKWNPGAAPPGFKIQGSNTAGNDWVDLATVPSTDGGLFGPGQTYTYHDLDLSSITTPYRYVRIYIPFSQAWGPKVRELEVYTKVPVSLPQVSLTGPSDQAAFLQGTNISLSANASEQGGTISKVEFYEGSNKLGEDLTAPYQFTWNNVQTGEYTIYARAYDALGQYAVSSPVAIHVSVTASGWSLNGNVGTPANAFMGTTDSKPLIFKTNGLERLRITADGRVGINTDKFPADDPTVALAVGGNIYARKLKITQATWADYVFDQKYKLPSLKEVEEYINQHHHLPGIPSAAKVIDNGLDVGDSQALLLQKIEELTLYVIQLNKEVEKLKAENAGLKARRKK
jgi:hypothetical protein